MMKSSAQMPGNPWPHDMSITVEDRPHTLLKLLWLREAYGLRPTGGDLPPLLMDTPASLQGPAISADTRAEWGEAWPRVWHAAVAHAGKDHDPGLFDELQSTADGSPERVHLLRRIVGPSWGDVFGGSAFDDESHATWSQRGMDAHLAAWPSRVETQPERRDLPALIRAWRAGLTKIVIIPCAGDFTRRVGENALLIDAVTRENSARYRHALSTFV